MRETTIDVRGVKVRALEAGAGPIVLFLHGLEGPRVDPLLAELTQGHRVIAPEIPGFGRSSVPDWMMSMADAALFGLDLVDSLGLGRVHLAGHSIGGWMAAEMAIRHPTAFASLTLISPMGVSPRAHPKDDIFVPAPDLVVRAQFHDAALAEKEIAARAGEEIDIVLQNRTGLARLAWTPRFANIQLPHWLHRVRAPTLVVWGEDDRITPVDCCDVFEREIEGAEVVRYAGCGHAVPYERGAETARVMGRFIAGVGA